MSTRAPGFSDERPDGDEERFTYCVEFLVDMNGSDEHHIEYSEGGGQSTLVVRTPAVTITIEGDREEVRHAFKRHYAEAVDELREIASSSDELELRVHADLVDAHHRHRTLPAIARINERATERP